MTMIGQRLRAIVPANIPASAVLPALCLVSAALAGIVASREYTVQAIAEAMRDPLDQGQTALADHANDEPRQLGDRANAGLAEIALSAAGQAQSRGERELALARARAAVEHLAQRRPDWATTQLLLAQLDVIQRGSPSATGLGAFGASYRQAPFLMQEARWRIAYGALYWARLPAVTRAAVLDEAEWLTRFDMGKRSAIQALFGDSPAGLAYQFRMASDHDTASESD
jgi:hypothetical protein